MKHPISFLTCAPYQEEKSKCVCVCVCVCVSVSEYTTKKEILGFNWLEYKL